MKLAILGSTGSIGRQALDIISDDITVSGLSCLSNVDLLYRQYLAHRPKWLHIGDVTKYEQLRDMVGDSSVRICAGQDGLLEFAENCDYDVLLTSIVGSIGLLPTIAAVKRAKRIALANKETLVVFGEKIMQLAAQYGAEIIPVDSEHSAIFQALQGNQKSAVEKLIVTASGGPFRGYDKTQLRQVSVEAALKHPKWQMGRKITIDSATLMNKGLEVIEARWLFDISAEQIEVVVHPECIIHSLVQYTDGSVMAQMGLQDMRLPIHYALNYPERKATNLQRLSLVDVATLNFYAPDMAAFPCLALAYRALEMGGTAPCVLNAANEVLVEQFLEKKIGFYDIAHGIAAALEKFGAIKNYTLDDILQTDLAVRQFTKSRVKG